jgi:hypothetical protein
MSYNFAVNRDAKIETILVGREQQPVIVIEDALADPASLVEFAARENRFGVPRNHYPGLRGETLPKPYVAGLLRTFGPALGKTFDVVIEGTISVNFYFGLATLPPARLSLLQRLPHFDTVNGNQIATLLYLCEPFHGGTSFFRHRATGFESIDAARKSHYFETLKREVEVHPPPARYAAGDDDLFEQIAGFEAKFNRMLVYRSSALHSGSIASETNFSADPRRGRLTANLFLICG